MDFRNLRKLKKLTTSIVSHQNALKQSPVDIFIPPPEPAGGRPTFARPARTAVPPPEPIRMDVRPGGWLVVLAPSPFRRGLGLGNLLGITPLIPLLSSHHLAPT